MLFAAFTQVEELADNSGGNNAGYDWRTDMEVLVGLAAICCVWLGVLGYIGYICLCKGRPNTRKAPTHKPSEYDEDERLIAAVHGGCGEGTQDCSDSAVPRDEEAQVNHIPDQIWRSNPQVLISRLEAESGVHVSND
jgi:hypothetical protein